MDMNTNFADWVGKTVVHTTPAFDGVSESGRDIWHPELKEAFIATWCKQNGSSVMFKDMNNHLYVFDETDEIECLP